MSTTATDAERLRGREQPAEQPIMRQTWRHLGFLHWPIDREVIAAVLPPGLHVDTFEGVAYVGIVPFTIPRSRLVGVNVPIAPAFHELNLRTYVHRNGRDHGVWFLSLEASSRLAVLGARMGYGLPYFHAQMSMQVEEGSGYSMVNYASRRTGNHGAAYFHGRYGPVGPAGFSEPGTLEFFLIERYLLYAWKGRTLIAARVFHAPYSVQSAAATAIDETIAATAGLTLPLEIPPLVNYAREVDVRIYRPHAVRV